MPTLQETARIIRQRHPERGRKFQDDQALVANWLQDHPDDARSITGLDEKKGIGRKIIPAALRIVPAALTPTGGPIGAAGAGGGEIAAQLFEFLTQGQRPRPKQLAGAAAIGAIPFSGPVKGLTRLRAVLGQAGKGAGLGTAATAITKVSEEGELPTGRELATGAGLGAVLGGGVASLGRRVKAATREISPARAAARLEPATARTLAKETPTELGGRIRQRRAIRTLEQPEIPPAGPIPEAKRFDFPSIQKMPEEIRPEIQRVMRTHEPRIAEARGGVQSFARQQALATRVEVALKQSAPGKAFNAPELTAYKNALSSIMLRQQPLAQKVAAGTATDLDKFVLMQMTQEQVALFATFRGAVAESGRAFGSLRQNARVLKMGNMAFMDALGKDPKLAKNSKRIAELVIEAGLDPIKQQKILSRETTTLFDKFSALYYNSLLSGVKTNLRNTIGTGLNMTAGLVNPIFAAPVDVLKKAITGSKREVFLGEVGKQLNATINAIPKAVSRFLFTMKHGFALDVAGPVAFDKNIATLPGGVVTNLPTRLLMATDIFFRHLAEQQELYAGAFAAARRAGLKNPTQIRDFMTKIMTGAHKDSAQLFKRAEAFARRTVFQEDPIKIVQKLIALKSDPKTPAPTKAFLTVLAPFMRTPANILRQGLESSPLGFLTKTARAGGREGAQQLGRATLGSLVLLPFMQLAASGRLSGKGPRDPAKRAELFEKGWQPNSVKIGDTWVRYQLFQPLSIPLGAVANAHDKFQESDQSDKSAEVAFAESLAATGSSLLDQSFLSGLDTFLNAINDPERGGAQFLSRTAQGFVPASGFLRGLAQATDPAIRRPEGIKEAIKTIIPGLSKQVTPRRTRFGEPVERPGGPIRRGFLVPQVSEEVQEPIAMMLEEAGITPQVPQARITRRGETLKLTREQEDLVVEAIGKERAARLGRFVGRRVAPEKLQRELSNVTRDVNERVYRLLKANRPLTLRALTQAAR